MLSKKIFLVIILLSLLSFLALAEENDCIYYFYGDECDDCNLLEPYFSGLTEKHPNLEIKKFDVYHNLSSYSMLNDYLKAYKVTGGNLIPIVFISGSYFVGKESITSFLEQRIIDNKKNICPMLEDRTVGVIGKGEPQNVLATLTFSVMSLEALNDLIKPGVIALVLALLTLLTLVKDRKEYLTKILLFMAGLLAAHLCFGAGLFDFFYNQTIYRIFYKFMGIVGIAFGLMGIKAFFSTKKKIANKIPSDLKRYLSLIHHYSMTSGGVFLVGFIISLFTFVSLSDKYYLLRSLFVDHFMRSAVLPLILYYNLLLILALFSIFIVFNHISSRLAACAESKLSSKEARLYEKHYLKLLVLGTRFLVLILGIILLFW